MRGLLQPKDQTCLLPSPGSAALFAFLLLPLSFNPGLQKLSLPQPWGDGGGALPWTTPSPLSFPPQTMVVALGLLLALLGCSAALDLALEEAWEGWKSLYAKEYTRVRAGPAPLLLKPRSTCRGQLRRGLHPTCPLWCSRGGCS